MRVFLRTIPVPFDLYVSVLRRAYADACLRINTDIQGAVVFGVDDRGGDMLPFLRIYSHVYNYKYKYICRVCTGLLQQGDAKDSHHGRSLNSLLGSSDRIVRVLETFDKHLSVGIVAPKRLVVTVSGGKKQNAGKGLPWFDKMVRLLADMGIDYRGEPFCFVPGGMFWFRPEALAGVLRRTWLDDEFPTDSAGSSEAMVHALEKVFGVVTGWSGFHIVMSSGTSRLIRPPRRSFPG
jgi:rhamnosyltransferase